MVGGRAVLLHYLRHFALDPLKFEVAEHCPLSETHRVHALLSMVLRIGGAITAYHLSHR